MSADRTQADPERQKCTPCRGTGRVISNLGGERREIACPWCEGSGEFKPGHDAQGGAAATESADGVSGAAESSQ